MIRSASRILATCALGVALGGAQHGEPSNAATALTGDAASGGAVAAGISDGKLSKNYTTKPVIVVDPGHGPNFSVVDRVTGLNMIESNNVPEITEVWKVAQIVKSKLERDGYTVLLTKPDISGAGITFRDRANVANNSHADLAVSIHDDHSQSFDYFKQIYPQEVNAYRGCSAILAPFPLTPAQFPACGKTIAVFKDASIAQKSMAYARIFQQERHKYEGGSLPVVKLNLFTIRSTGFEPGDIPMVQLFANVPWVYNEVGGISAGPTLSQADLTKYAQGLIGGVEQSVPLPKGHATRP